jgi:hypothetical protein
MSNTDDSATSLADARRMVAEGRHVHIGAKISMEGLIWICLDRDDVARLTAAAGCPASQGDDRQHDAGRRRRAELHAWPRQRGRVGVLLGLRREAADGG